MEKISFESILATLFLLGYKNIDYSLFNSALEAIYMGEDFDLCKNNNNLFKYIVTLEDDVFKLKNNLSINSMVKINDNIIPVRKILEFNANSLLKEYLYGIRPDNKKSQRIVK